MSGRTIALTPSDVWVIRRGHMTAVEDSTGQIVDVAMFPLPANGDVRVTLSAGDLDLIERQPEGLVVADTARSTGWTIRMEAA